MGKQDLVFLLVEDSEYFRRQDTTLLLWVRVSCGQSFRFIRTGS
jgi:hypothetical protein